MKDFEARLGRLEDLAQKIKDPELPLEEAIGVFEEGMKLSKSLKRELERMQGKVEILLGEPDAGPQAESAAFEPDEEG